MQWNVINAEGFESRRRTDACRSSLRGDTKLTWLFPTSSFHKCLMFSTPASVVRELPLQMRICKCSYWGTWNKVTKTKESPISRWNLSQELLPIAHGQNSIQVVVIRFFPFLTAHRGNRFHALKKIFAKNTGESLPAMNTPLSVDMQERDNTFVWWQQKIFIFHYWHTNGAIQSTNRFSVYSFLD